MKPETPKTLPTIAEKGEIVLYQPNESICLEVRLENETIWMTQQQIADLFGVKQPAISKHLKNIFNDGELDENSVYSILEYTAADGKRIVYNYQTWILSRRNIKKNLNIKQLKAIIVP